MEWPTSTTSCPLPQLNGCHAHSHLTSTIWPPHTCLTPSAVHVPNLIPMPMHTHHYPHLNIPWQPPLPHAPHPMPHPQPPHSHHLATLYMSDTLAEQAPTPPFPPLNLTHPIIVIPRQPHQPPTISPDCLTHPTTQLHPHINHLDA